MCLCVTAEGSLLPSASIAKPCQATARPRAWSQAGRHEASLIDSPLHAKQGCREALPGCCDLWETSCAITGRAAAKEPRSPLPIIVSTGLSMEPRCRRTAADGCQLRLLLHAHSIQKKRVEQLKMQYVKGGDPWLHGWSGRSSAFSLLTGPMKSATVVLQRWRAAGGSSHHHTLDCLFLLGSEFVQHGSFSNESCLRKSHVEIAGRNNMKLNFLSFSNDLVWKNCKNESCRSQKVIKLCSSFEIFLSSKTTFEFLKFKIQIL